MAFPGGTVVRPCNRRRHTGDGVEGEVWSWVRKSPEGGNTSVTPDFSPGKFLVKAWWAPDHQAAGQTRLSGCTVCTLYTASAHQLSPAAPGCTSLRRSLLISAHLQALFLELLAHWCEVCTECMR